MTVTMAMAPKSTPTETKGRPMSLTGHHQVCRGYVYIGDWKEGQPTVFSEDVLLVTSTSIYPMVLRTLNTIE